MFISIGNGLEALKEELAVDGKGYKN